MRVALAKKASADILTAAKWWKTNRDKAPALFQAELQQALELLASQPLAGVIVVDEEVENLRRLALLRTRYFLFYEVDAGGHVTVLRLWHASRGRVPRLR